MVCCLSHGFLLHSSYIYLFFKWNLLFPISLEIIPLIFSFIYFAFDVLSSVLLCWNELFYFKNTLNCTYISISFNIGFFFWCNSMFGRDFFSPILKCCCMIFWLWDHWPDTLCILLLGSFHVVWRPFSINSFFFFFFLIPNVKGQQAIYSLLLKEKQKEMAGSPINMSQVSGHVLSFSSNVVYSDIANL